MANDEGINDFTVKYDGRGAIYDIYVDGADDLRALTGLVSKVVGGANKNAVGMWTSFSKTGDGSLRISAFVNTDEDCDDIALRLRKVIPSLSHITWRPTTPDETKDTMFIMAAMASNPRAKTIPGWRK